jgi:hypothetical protein
MSTFVASMTYELHASTDPDARKLLRAELAGRRWRDKWGDARMPGTAVWMTRKEADELTTDDVHRQCGRELEAAVAAVGRTGRPIQLLRAWVQVSGGGTYGLLSLASTTGAAAAGDAAAVVPADEPAPEPSKPENP